MRGTEALVCGSGILFAVAVWTQIPWIEKLLAGPTGPGAEVPAGEGLEGDAAFCCWVVSGAGDGSYDGLYRLGGPSGSYPWYANDEGRCLYWLGEGRWGLGPCPFDASLAYSSEGSGSLPAEPWIVAQGVGPPPRVSLGAMAAVPVVLTARGDGLLGVREALKARRSYQGHWREGLTGKLFVGPLLVDETEVTRDVWGKPIQWEGRVAPLHEGSYTIHSELWCEGHCTARSPAVRCEAGPP